MKEFQEDSSANKSATHTKLKASLLRLGDSFMWTVYTVAELKRLCATCNIKLTNKIRRKIDIAKLLLPVVKTSNFFACPFYLDKLHVKHTNNANGPLHLTIRMMKN